MAERSFAEEVGKLRLGAGETFRGEGILAVTKALLESGVSYVAGYQGAPISHLMDVLADAEDILVEHGIRFENSASEATAAATLAASVNYPLRGAVTFKGPVGVNVASDALANLASGGVTGGALVIVGEDYGEGSSIMQERSHAFAMKSQIWLLDPRPNLPSIVAAVKAGFELSEASRTPVMIELRIRACHVHGQFTASANRRPPFTLAEAMATPARDLNRITLPPMSYAHEREKIEERWPAAVRFIEERKLNEFIDAERRRRERHRHRRPGRPLQRGAALARAARPGRRLRPLAGADLRHERRLPGDRERGAALRRRQARAPDRRGRAAELHRADPGDRASPRRLDGRAARQGPAAARRRVHARRRPRRAARVPRALRTLAPANRPIAPAAIAPAALAAHVHARPPGFCTGCPERPIFSAIKLVEKELGAHHMSADIGCHLFSILPPFHLGNTTMGYGLGTAGASAFSAPVARGAGEALPGKRAISVMGDGGFWHNGLTSGIANAVFNRSDNLTIVVDNNYTSATGGQELLSSHAGARLAQHRPRDRAGGARRRRRVGEDGDAHLRRLGDARRAARRADDEGGRAEGAGRAVGVHAQPAAAREAARARRRSRAAKRVVRERFGVDSDTCTGDHSCIRLSGCPSLSIKANPDPLRTDPVATVLDSCVGCGVCGEVSHAAVLCPSFYKARIVSNPTGWDRFLARVRAAVIGALQRRDARRRARFAF